MNPQRVAFRGLAILAAVTCLTTAAGCAKSPTVVNVQVAVDDTTPPLVLLRSTIALQAAPDMTARNDIVSRYEGDGGLAAPFVFPMLFPVSVPPGWAGDVVITIEGIDWQNGKVIATGMASATAVREKTTETTVTLTGVAAPAGSGDGGMAVDASPGGDGPGADTADGGTPEVD